jgi:hypothetical protein
MRVGFGQRIEKHLHEQIQHMHTSVARLGRRSIEVTSTRVYDSNGRACGVSAELQHKRSACVRLTKRKRRGKGHRLTSTCSLGRSRLRRL